MKKLILCLLVLPAVCFLTACGKSDDDIDGDTMVTLNASNLTEDGYFDGIMYYKITSNFPRQVAVAKVLKSAVSIEIPTIINIEGSNYTCTSIGDRAFYECYELTLVTIPNSITSIGYDAFAFCQGLTSVCLPNSMASIADGAFRRCSGLTTIYCKNTIPPSQPWYGVFEDYIYDKATLYIPKGSRKAYRSAYGWYRFANVVEE